MTAPSTLQLTHASQSWRDPDSFTRDDIRAALKRGSHAVTFTEVSRPNGNVPILKTACADLGYTMIFDEETRGTETAIAVKSRYRILEEGSVVANEAEPGKPPHDGHSRRVITWVRFRMGNENVFLASAHWVTGYKHQADRRTEHEKLSADLVDLVQRYGKGTDLAFWAGDTNVADGRSVSPGYEVLAEGGLTTCWDELRVWPVTHSNKRGGDTIDVIGSYDRDARVSCISGRSHELNYADHHQITARYKIVPKHSR